MDRREFAAGAWKSLIVALFAGRVAAADLLSPRARGKVRAWVAAHDDIARALVSGRITGRQWQSEVERLANEVDIAELLAQIDFAKLERTLDLSRPGGTKHLVQLDHPDGSSRRLSFATAVFGLRKGHAITPHAHRNMVSAHMVISGELHVRNFDRLGEEPGHLIVAPTVDTTIRPGDLSTMSTERNNVHWFTAKTAKAFTLDVIIDGLTPNQPRYEIELLDVNDAEKLANGRRRARIITWEESVRRYGVEGG